MTVVASDHVIIAGTPLPQQNQIGVVMQWICIQNWGLEEKSKFKHDTFKLKGPILYCFTSI